MAAPNPQCPQLAPAGSLGLQRPRGARGKGQLTLAQGQQRGEQRAGDEAGELSEDLGNGKNGSSAGIEGWESHQMGDLTKGWEPPAS